MKAPSNPLGRMLSITLGSIALHSPAIAQQTPEVNGIAAKVNGKVITKNEVGILLFPQMKRLEARFPGRGPEFEKQLHEAQQAVLQELIDRKQMLAQPNLPPIPIDPRAIDAEVQREIRDNYAGRLEQFDAALRMHRMTREGFRRIAQDKLLVEALKIRQANKK